MQILAILSNFLISEVYLSRWNIETSYFFLIKNSISCSAFPYTVSSELPLHNLGVKLLWIGDEKYDEKYGYGNFPSSVLTTSPFGFYLPLDFYYGSGRKDISDIYGYPAFSEVSLALVSFGTGLSILIPCQKNFYFETAGEIKMGIGPYDLKIGIIRNGKEVILYEGKQENSGPWVLDGIISLGYKFPFGLILLSTGVEYNRMPFPATYNNPTEYDYKNSSWGFKVGLKARRHLGAKWYDASRNCCLF